MRGFSDRKILQAEWMLLKRGFVQTRGILGERGGIRVEGTATEGSVLLLDSRVCCCSLSIQQYIMLNRNQDDRFIKKSIARGISGNNGGVTCGYAGRNFDQQQCLGEAAH